MSSEELPGILVAVLLMLGMGHSIWWARRAWHRKRMDGRLSTLSVMRETLLL